MILLFGIILGNPRAIHLAMLSSAKRDVWLLGYRECLAYTAAFSVRLR